MEFARQALKTTEQLAPSDPKYSALKKHIKSARTNLEEINHIETWKEMTDGTVMTKSVLSVFLNALATLTVDFNCELEAAKGVVRALR